MKRLLVSILIVIGFINVSTGQSSTYGISIGVGKGFIMKQELYGGSSFDLNLGFSIGFQYVRKLTNKLHLMTGVNWYGGSISVTPACYPGNDSAPTTYGIQLIYIPVLLKVDLSKHFFLNGGLIGDFDITKEKHITNQSGLGVGLGIGTEFSITPSFLIQINPYINLHGLILTNSDNHPERILDAGIKLNLLLNK